MYGLGSCSCGQVDVEADAHGAGFERAAVGGFHYAGAAAGHDVELRAAVGWLGRGNDSAELAGFVVEVAFGHDPFGPLKCAGHFRIVGRFLGVESRFSQNGFGLLAGHDLRAAENDDRGIDVMFAEERFRFEQLELHPQRAVFLALKEVDVDLGELIAGRLEDRQSIGGDVFGECQRWFVESAWRCKFGLDDGRVVDFARGIVGRGRDLASDGFVWERSGFSRRPVRRAVFYRGSYRCASTSNQFL